MSEQKINELIKLSKSKQIVFAYILGLRVVPTCRQFFDKYHLNLEDLDNAIEVIETSILSPNYYSSDDVDSLYNKVLKLVPDTEDYDDPNATIAMYFTIVISEGINLCKKGTDSKLILQSMVQEYLNAIDCYIQVRDDMDYEDEKFEDRIISDALMVKEKVLQIELIDFLKVNEINDGSLKSLISNQESEKLLLILE